MEIQEINTPITIQLIPYQGFNTLRFGDEYATVRQKLSVIKPLDAEAHHFYLREYYEAMNMSLGYTYEGKLSWATFLFSPYENIHNYLTFSDKFQFICGNIEIKTTKILELTKLFTPLDTEIQYYQYPNANFLLLPMLGLVFHEYYHSGLVESLELFTYERLDFYLDRRYYTNN
jgi:hypothetical protein